MSWIKHIFRVLLGWHWNFSVIKITKWLSQHPNLVPEAQHSWRRSPLYFFPPSESVASSAAPETPNPFASRMIIPSSSFLTSTRWTTSASASTSTRCWGSTTRLTASHSQHTSTSSGRREDSMWRQNLERHWGKSDNWHCTHKIFTK